ncbi:MAG: FemAB family XrtA/PEP-CTERM system-associated protein [Planctomycetaceae bacterium]
MPRARSAGELSAPRDIIESSIEIRVTDGANRLSRQCGGTAIPATAHPDHDPRWLRILAEGLGHEPFLLEAVVGGRVAAQLRLAHVHSLLFGRFLVSLPYLNSAGVQADDPRAAHALIDRAVELTDELNCRFLELRHESPWEHPALSGQMTSKVHMRLDLPETAEELWQGLKAGVRNQVRKGQRQDFGIHWGAMERLEDFYAVFSRNMRDLGTPVYGRSLFAAILRAFGERGELCCVYDGGRCIAAALLIHGAEATAVPSASSLRAYHSTNANMLMYWHLLERAVERGQKTFDFGRATRDSNLFRFKNQWRARAEPAAWQYYARRGTIDAMRPDNARNRRLTRIWRRLPLALTRLIGPTIIRGVP